MWIVIEAIQRFGHTETIDTTPMLVVALIGLLVNAASAAVLARRQHDNLNIKGAYMHVLSDLLGSFAVIVAGLIIRYTGFHAADTIASVVIAALILPRSIALLRQALGVLLEQVPAGTNIEDIRATLLALDGVQEVHDLHVWSVDGTDILASAHLVTPLHQAELVECGLLDAATAALSSHGIEHSTIQVESSAHADHEGLSHH